MLTSLDGVIVEYLLRFSFKTSKNEAKYETLIARLKITKVLGVKKTKVFTNS